MARLDNFKASGSRNSTPADMREAMLGAGLDPPLTLIADGKIHAFSTNGKASDKAGRYVLHTDPDAGAFWDWRNGGEIHTWCAKGEGNLDPAERKQMRERMKRAAELRQAEEEKERAAAQKRAQAEWAALPDATEAHPYLKAKGVKPHGTKITKDGRLVIALQDSAGTIHSLEHIDAAGGKMFLKGGRKKGCFFAIGEIGPIVVLAEGFATAATVHEATGLPVAVAFDCGNLLPVAQELRAILPDARLVFAADDDLKTEGNPGRTKAEEAARAVGGTVVLPRFGGEQPEGASDFNDLAKIHGLAAVKQDFADALKEPAAAAAKYKPKHLGAILQSCLDQAKRRCAGIDKPIRLPWASLNEHFGGGLWPGLHMLTKGTGTGGTQFALQAAMYAAKHGNPVLYIGLELGELDLVLRLLAEEARIPWSTLWTGTAGPVYVQRAEEAIPVLRELPFFHEVARPHGFPPSAVSEAIRGIREAFPEPDGPGSLPMLVVVDFLQIIGDEADESEDTRVRIGRASYVLRDAAKTMGVAILCISSVAREKYRLLANLQGEAGLSWTVDDRGRPTKRSILNPDAIVGTSKESGDIEFSADSVSVLARVPGTWDGAASDAVFATAKGRATGTTWSPLRFTGWRYEECEDEGRGVLDAWAAAGDAKESAREQKRAAKEQAKSDKIQADADAVRAYVEKHPGCSVREARINTVGDSSPRWANAVAFLGKELVIPKPRTKDGLFLASARKNCGIQSVGVDNPPHTPPVSTPTVDTAGAGPCGTVDGCGMSTASTVSTVFVIDVEGGEV